MTFAIFNMSTTVSVAYLERSIFLIEGNVC